MSHTEVYRVRVGDRGRVVLPAELRRRLGLHQGEELVLEVSPEGDVRAESLTDRASRLRGSYRHLGHAAGRDGIVDELLQERRAEASADEAGAGATTASRGRTRSPRT